MYSRFLVPALVAAALAAAFGPTSHSSEVAPAAAITAAVDPGSGPRPGPRPRPRKGDTASAIAAVLEVRVDDPIELALVVTNRGEKTVELQFPDGQTHDVVVLDARGDVVWTWSEGRLFTQALRNQMLTAGETTTFVERLPIDLRLPAGTYTAVATLRSSNHPIEERTGFTVK